MACTNVSGCGAPPRAAAPPARPPSPRPAPPRPAPPRPRQFLGRGLDGSHRRLRGGGRTGGGGEAEARVFLPPPPPSHGASFKRRRWCPPWATAAQHSTGGRAAKEEDHGIGCCSAPARRALTTDSAGQLTTYLAENGLRTLGAVAQASAAYDPERAQGLALAAGSEPAGFYGFGPTDEAFAALFDALNTTAEYMLGPDGISTTNDVLNYHGYAAAARAACCGAARTATLTHTALQAPALRVQLSGGHLVGQHDRVRRLQQRDHPQQERSVLRGGPGHRRGAPAEGVLLAGAAAPGSSGTPTTAAA